MSYKINRLGCREYAVTVEDGCILQASYTSLTKEDVDFEGELSSGTNTLELPYDGIYELSLQGTCSSLDIIQSQIDLNYLGIRLLYLEIQPSITETINGVTIDGVLVYDPIVHGGATLSAPSNMLNAVSTYVSANTTVGNVYFYAPGVPMLTGYENIFPDTTNYRLLLVGDGLGDASIEVSNVSYPVATYLCTYNANVYTGTLPSGYNYVVSVQVEGEELLAPTYELVNDSTALPLITAELQNHGTLVFPNNPGDNFATLELQQGEVCPTVQIGFVEGVEQQTTIDVKLYLFEACRLHDCFLARLNEWLCCNDPCDDPCLLPSEDPAHDLDLLSDMTMWGMYLLIQEGKFASLDDIPIVGQVGYDKVVPLKEVWNTWYKLLDGCGCGPVNNDCGCTQTTTTNDCGCS